MTESPAVISGGLKRPFAEQVAFFRRKLGNLVPTSRWDDIERAAHDRGFMVAGAAKADLLADLAAAVDRAISEGKSLGAFRKDFGEIVERRGWRGWTGDESPARRAWRTRTIYATNASASYNAGREAQLQEAGFELKVYRHSGLSAEPRPEHLAWDGLTLPAGHEFWRSHSPQNGWGCKCYVLGARSERSARRLGGDPAKPLPGDWDAIDPKTGAPVGIDQGWDYAPGASTAEEAGRLAAKTQQWDYTLAKAFMEEAPNRDALAAAYRSLPSVADDSRRYAQAVLAGREAAPYRTLGLLTEADAAEVRRLKGMEVGGFDYALDASTVRHILGKHGDRAAEAARGQRAVTAADYGRLPRLLNAPDQVEDGGMSEIGRPVLRYAKEIGGEIHVAAFEVRKGRRMLALQSMWIRPGRPPR